LSVRPVLLFDVYAILYRALFALPPLTTSAGEPTAALYGLASLLLKLLREEEPAGCAWAIDAPAPTFRKQAYPDYKATRPRLPTFARAGRLDELLATTGFPVFSSAGYEADDVLATLCRDLVPAGAQPVIVTGDLDCLQLVRGPVEVLMLLRLQQARRYDEAAVRRRFGVAPEVLPELRALSGDPSDNLPGVPAIGPRTAARLLQRFGTLESVLAHADELTARQRDALLAHAREVSLWAELSRLRDDVPLPPGPRHRPLDEEARSRLRDLFRILEFRTLLPRLEALSLPRPPAC
jgi:DNA polymerase-1